MKRRNPIFVAAFPYVSLFIGYLMFVFINIAYEDNAEFDTVGTIVLLSALSLFVVGVVYNLYWAISTARVLRAKTKYSIPNAVLLIIPIASYWWMWRYSQAAEKYVKNKAQAALIFILLALLGSIGNGIMQDYYNKQSPAKSGSR